MQRCGTVDIFQVKYAEKTGQRPILWTCLVSQWLEQCWNGDRAKKPIYPSLIEGHLVGVPPRFAIFLNTAGGAWDNAKKYIEQGWQWTKMLEKIWRFKLGLAHCKITILFRVNQPEMGYFQYRAMSNDRRVVFEKPGGGKPLNSSIHSIHIIGQWLFSRWVIPEGMPTIYSMPSEIIPLLGTSGKRRVQQMNFFLNM